MNKETTPLTPQGCVAQIRELLKHNTFDKTARKTHTDMVLQNAAAMIERLMKEKEDGHRDIGDFDIMKEMSRRDMDIAMTNNLQQLQSSKRGGLVTMGVDTVTFNRLVADQAPGKSKYLIGFYVINREQYNQVKQEFLNK